jgi:hypothetical protein
MRPAGLYPFVYEGSLPARLCRNCLQLQDSFQISFMSRLNSSTSSKLRYTDAKRT